MSQKTSGRGVKAGKSGISDSAVDAVTGAARVKKGAERQDKGLENLFNHVSWNEDDHFPNDRISMANWLSQDSPKLQYLAGLLKSICIDSEQKLLIPATGRSSNGMPADKRNDTMFMFNDPAHPAKILLTNLACSATSANFQKCCSHILFLELGNNVADLLQGLGRGHRIGQKKRLKIYVLTIDHTFDQVMQAKQTQKYLPQFAASCDIDVGSLRHLHEFQGGQGSDDQEVSREDVEKWSEELEELKGLLQTLLGQRSYRGNKEWSDSTDFHKKDDLIGEQQYMEWVEGGNCHYK